MADGKKSFLLYCDIQSTINKLSDEQSGKLFKIILGYVNDQNPIVEDVLLDLVFEPIKQQLKRDLKRYESIVEKRSLAGLASADKRKQLQQVSTSVESVQQVSTNPTDIDTDNVIDNVKGKEKKKEDNANKLAARSTEFQKTLIPYLGTYTKEMLRSFADYWTEPNQSKTKMLYEMQKTWDVGRRLKTWASRESTFKNKQSDTTATPYYKPIKFD